MVDVLGVAVAKPASTGTSVRAVSHRGELTVEDVWPEIGLILVAEGSASEDRLKLIA